jgi:GNAT superfamily N-acetyltransferase
MAIEFRAGTRHDVERLTSIAHAAKRHWGYPESWIAAWRQDLTMTPEIIERDDVRAATSDGKLAGFIVLALGLRSMELEAMWVDPEFIGRGIGRALFEHAVERTSSKGVATLEITSDPNAESFYRHMGAERVGAVPAPVLGNERLLPRLILKIAGR